MKSVKMDIWQNCAINEISPKSKDYNSALKIQTPENFEILADVFRSVFINMLIMM